MFFDFLSFNDHHLPIRCTKLFRHTYLPTNLPIYCCACVFVRFFAFPNFFHYLPCCARAPLPFEVYLSRFYNALHDLMFVMICFLFVTWSFVFPCFWKYLANVFGANTCIAGSQVFGGRRRTVFFFVFQVRKMASANIVKQCHINFCHPSIYVFFVRAVFVFLVVHLSTYQCISNHICHLRICPTYIPTKTCLNFSVPWFAVASEVAYRGW